MTVLTEVALKNSCYVSDLEPHEILDLSCSGFYIIKKKRIWTTFASSVNVALDFN